jgi:hypothetical protein
MTSVVESGESWHIARCAHVRFWSGCAAFRLFAVSALIAALLAGCAGAAPGTNAPTAYAEGIIGLFTGGGRTLTSFLGVRFGDDLYRVQQRMPSGEAESAPYGADAFRVDNVTVDGILWERVIFEFTESTGMQLVMARFSAPSATTVYTMLEKTIGPPTTSRQGAGTTPATLDAIWELPHEERVTFDGPRRLVAVVGPAGGPLKKDLPLAEANGLI